MRRTLIGRSAAIQHENSSIHTVIKSGVVLICHCRIHHHYVMLTMVVQIRDEFLHLLQGESIRIQSEDLLDIRESSG